MSTFSGIEMGKRSLFAHSRSIQTAGHNVSNSSTEGYSRQRVELRATDPLYRPDLSRAETSGQIGQGVSVESVRRLRDTLLDKRIVAQTEDTGYWETRDKYLLMMEQVYLEPDETSVRTRMDQFWDAWEELSLYPESKSARQSIVTRGETLTDAIHNQYRALRGIGDMVNGDIEAVVRQVNDLASRIAALNEEIVKVKAMGDQPNDLMDRRDLLTEKLSSLVGVTFDIRDRDEEYVIHLDGMELVQGKTARAFALAPGLSDDGYSRVVWEGSGEEAVISGGKLGALLELRDSDIRSQIQSVDTMTMNFVDLVNSIHREGTSPNGRTGVDFFVEQYFIENTAGNYDRDGDGAADSSYIFRVTGANALSPRAQIGLEGVMTFSSADGTVQVPYAATDMVSDVVARINHSGAEVTASLDQAGRLVLKGTAAADPANPDFVIRHMEDSGRFLAGYAGVLGGYGAENAYTWEQADAVNLLAGGVQHAVAPVAHPSGWIELNPAVKSDVSTVAAGTAEQDGTLFPGENSVAAAIARIRNTAVMVGSTRTFDDYFADAVTEIGLKGEQAKLSLETQNAVLKELKDMRDSVSGVNIDEELADIIKFQHGYNAAARFIATVNDMLDTVINRMGV